MNAEYHSRDLRSPAARLLGLSLLALGVVYGDIGTSPLYTVSQVFFGTAAKVTNPVVVLGGISAIFWALTLVVTFKYVVFVLRADHQAEGGVFALYGLLQKHKTRVGVFLLILLTLAAGFLFGDGMITPAISVISAVEGIAVAAPNFSGLIIPITILILSALFFVQRKGTSAIGTVFGPVMLVWFFVLGLMGASWIIREPQILQALNPQYILLFFKTVSVKDVFVILGFVMLAITGGEAMYADLGHFGRAPIRISWLFVAYPALVLNYFGQGAYVLSGNPVIDGNIFYSMAPHALLGVLIVLATMATIIASQALITGVFSLAAQASALHLLPLIPIKHTHHHHEGQIYIGSVNTLLYAGCIALVLYFGSSSRMAGAYGMAVSWVMLATTVAVSAVMLWLWKWPVWKTLLFSIPFASIDLVFVIANSFKFLEGGFVPLGIGLVAFFVMQAWQWGSGRLSDRMNRSSRMKIKDLFAIRDNEAQASFVNNTTVILSNDMIKSLDDVLPPLDKLYFERNAVMPDHLVFLTVRFWHEPSMAHKRLEIVELDPTPERGTILSVAVNFGFMENADLKSALHEIIKREPSLVHQDIKDWVFHIIVKRLYFENSISWLDRMRYGVYKFLYEITPPMDVYLGLNHYHNITLEVLPVVFRS